MSSLQSVHPAKGWDGPVPQFTSDLYGHYSGHLLTTAAEMGSQMFLHFDIVNGILEEMVS